VAEVATTLFITNDKPNIAGMILAGSADFKTELSQSDIFDPVRNLLSGVVVKWNSEI
jgi:peptide chain release factor subunit 1